MTTIAFDHLETPVGRLYLFATEQALCGLGFPGAEMPARQTLEKYVGHIEWRAVTDPLGLTTRLRHYFDGKLDAIEGIPVVLSGTPFQQRVWNALRNIPLGKTVSYRHIAEQIGAPSACRAVGLANGRNPVAIVIPCHRVIGANATLTGYGGGLPRKQWLLQHEGADVADAKQLRLV